MLEELTQANEYIYSKLPIDSELEELKKYAISQNVPIISDEVASFLKFILLSGNIKNVLEIGTAIGYSGLIISKLIASNNGLLYTIEKDEQRYNEAIDNFKKYNRNNVKCVLGDAEEQLDKISGEISEPFDLIFIDASKGHYQGFFEKSLPMLNKSGLVFIDNLLFRGYLYKDYPKRYSTIVRKLDNFITELYKDNRGDFTLLPFGDGVGLFRKTK